MARNSLALAPPRVADAKKVIRCAIYTRKSTEEGLQQEFNSLDAQREASEAFVASQKQEGWQVITDHFDDGGYTGGNMNRPALKRLLAAVEAHLVDCIVVYKVDRLSRSLMDFARIIEIFDRNGVSFVAVTQQFNTTSSLGRLTLNILLSFAQFEREIISERTRDKMSAARRKGKWIGGHPVLGYDIDSKGGRIIINAVEAEQVRTIFQLYLERGSLLPVLQECPKRGLVTKRWTTEDGNVRGGKPLTRGSLHAVLANVLYTGMVDHKGVLYAGEHDRIIDQETWDRVHETLRHNGSTKGATVRNKRGALLRGLLFCLPCGTPMMPAATLGAIDKLLRRCLAKERKQRLQAIGEGRIILERPQSEEPSASGANAPPPWRHGKLWPAAAALLAMTTAVALWASWRSTQSVESSLVRLDVDLGADISLPPYTAGGSSVAISPDGTRLAYVSGTPGKLFTRRLDQPKATELPGTDGASRPFFSPDGQWVGFAAGIKVNKISVEGGAVVPLAEIANFGGGSWGEDGSIVLSDVLGKGLLRIPAGGGSPEIVVGLGKGEFVLGLPQILPGGKAILFVASKGGADALTIEVFTLADGHRKIVNRGGNSPRYLSTLNRKGYLAYVNKATLFAVPFDLDKLETRGTAVPVLDDVAYESFTGGGQLDFSRNGTLVYRKANGGAYALTTVQWVHPTDGPIRRNEPLRAKPDFYQDPSLSLDGNSVALTIDKGEIGDVWVYNPQSDSMTRLTFGDAIYRNPTWSPEGKYVVFSSIPRGIFQARSDGAGQPQALTQGPQIPGSFTPDGKRLAYTEGSARGQIWTVPIEEQRGKLKAGAPEQFLKSSSNEQTPSFSPDGRWLAYQSNKSGADEVYVRPFPTPASGQDEEWRISNSGGTVPRWSRGGHELVYQSGNQILATSYTVQGDTFVAEKTRVWLAKLEGTITLYQGFQRTWDLAPDGKRMAVLTPVESAEAPRQEHEVVFLENFFDYLQRIVPVGK